MPEGIGAVNFLNSIVNYIILLTSLGIPLYAVKEVAKYRDDKPTRDKITIEILILSTLLCIGGYILVWILAEFVPEIQSQSSLFFILSLSILFNTVGINWFYQAIEDFKFITVRALIIRTLSTVALFIFVKAPADLLIYGMIIVGSTVGNNIINLFYLKKFIHCSGLRFSQLKIFRHVKPSLQLFVLNLIVSLYVYLNSVMLGFMTDDKQVGYFTAGTKITYIAITVISSIGTVLLPRCSYLIEAGKMEDFKSVIKKSLILTVALSLPLTFGIIILAEPITMVFCGSAYIDSIPVIYLNAPVIVFISISTLTGTSILYPLGKLKQLIISVSFGALINLVFNFVLIPDYKAVGAAMSTLIAEFLVLVIQFSLAHEFFPFRIKYIFNLNYIIGTILMAITVLILVKVFDSYTLQILSCSFIGVIVYFSYLLMVNDPVSKEMKNFLSSKFKK